MFGNWRTYSTRNKDILREDDLLSLNDEEVDELVDISDKRVEGLLGNGIVFLWADLGGEASREEGLSSNLSQHSDTQNHICKLEAVSENIEVSGGEDEEDGCEVGNAGGAGVLP